MQEPPGWRGNEDPNSRGLGLALRVVGALVPMAVLFTVALLNIEQRMALKAPVATDFLRVAGYLWGVPFGGYRVAPWTFGLTAVATLACTALLLVRRDRRGAVAAFFWCLFFAWLVSLFVGSGD